DRVGGTAALGRAASAAGPDTTAAIRTTAAAAARTTAVSRTTAVAVLTTAGPSNPVAGRSSSPADALRGDRVRRSTTAAVARSNPASTDPAGTGPGGIHPTARAAAGTGRAARAALRFRTPRGDPGSVRNQGWAPVPADRRTNRRRSSLELLNRGV